MPKNITLLVRYDIFDRKAKVIQEGIYLYNNSLIVKVWIPDIKLFKEELFLFLIGIKLLGLDFRN